MLGNQLGFIDLPVFVIPEAKADSPAEHSELGIIAVLAESDLLDDKTDYETEGAKATLREHIFAYAENAQGRIPNAQAIVIGVEPGESAFKIATVLEKLYYED